LEVRVAGVPRRPAIAASSASVTQRRGMAAGGGGYMRAGRWGGSINMAVCVGMCVCACVRGWVSKKREVGMAEIFFRAEMIGYISGKLCLYEHVVGTMCA